MPISASCPSCGAKINAPDNLAGRSVKCPKCANPFTVPAAGAAADAIQATPAAPAYVAPPTPPRRPAREARDEDADWDDDRARDDYDRGRAPAAGSNGLAIAGMVLGIVGFVLAFIPCAGWLLAIVMGITGAVLSGIGLASANKLQSGKGMAIAGLVLSILAIIWGPAWFFIYFYAATRALGDAFQQAAQQAAAQQAAVQQGQPPFVFKDKGIEFQPNFPVQPIDPNAPPTPATGKLTLNNGQASVQGNLAANDPKDRMRPASVCKVFTINMVAGKNYQIDMIKGNDLDPYLRLEDSAGKNLAQDDDSGGNLNARLVFNCTQTGEYRIVATTFIGGIGNFTLQVTEK